MNGNCCFLHRQNMVQSQADGTLTGNLGVGPEVGCASSLSGSGQVRQGSGWESPWLDSAARGRQFNYPRAKRTRRAVEGGEGSATDPAEGEYGKGQVNSNSYYGVVYT